LLNAAHALADCREGGEISVRTHTDGPRRVLIDISDNGSGIPKPVIGRIFEPFFTTKEPGQGTGLGLSICHGIIASLGGEIVVESEFGHGTNFRIQLPASDENRVRASAE
jgi:signal transduction histidine kinase